MSGVVAPYNETVFFDKMVANRPDLTGWIHKDDTDDWYFVITNPDPITKSKHFHRGITNITTSNTKNVFNKYGRSPKCLAFCHLDKPSGIIDPVDLQDLESVSWSDVVNYEEMICYNQAKDGLAKGYIRLKLKDKKYHTFYFNDDGFSDETLLIDGKLYLNGLIADKYMLEGPSKLYGTVMRRGLPFLCDAEGHVLNNEKSKYIDEDKGIYYYVNSDKTFFYSSDPDDEKWY